ncbi:MAG: iron donor protein CyaY [Caldimonas sp.]
MSTNTSPAHLSDSEYQAHVLAALGLIESTIDRWLQADLIDIDTLRTGGLLELSFPDNSKIIVNAQPPLQELWLAARSGGMHFKWVAGCWVDTRSQREFFETLSACATEQAGRPLHFALAD